MKNEGVKKITFAEKIEFYDPTSNQNQVDDQISNVSNENKKLQSALNSNPSQSANGVKATKENSSKFKRITDIFLKLFKFDKTPNTFNSFLITIYSKEKLTTLTPSEKLKHLKNLENILINTINQNEWDLAIKGVKKIKADVENFSNVTNAQERDDLIALDCFCDGLLGKGVILLNRFGDIKNPKNYDPTLISALKKIKDQIKDGEKELYKMDLSLEELVSIKLALGPEIENTPYDDVKYEINSATTNKKRTCSRGS